MYRGYNKKNKRKLGVNVQVCKACMYRDIKNKRKLGVNIQVRKAYIWDIKKNKRKLGVKYKSVKRTREIQNKNTSI